MNSKRDIFYNSLKSAYRTKTLFMPLFLISISIASSYFFILWQFSEKFKSINVVEVSARASQTLFFSLGTIFLYFLLSKLFSSNRQVQVDSNNHTQKRIDKICDLIDSCEEELVIVSGSFNGNVYDSTAVLESVDAMPAGVRISAYVESKNDDHSHRKTPEGRYSVDPVENITGKKFIKKIMDRNARIGYVMKDTPHVIVVDKQNVRIELEPKKPDDAEKRKALIFYHSLDLADAVSDIVTEQAC